METIDALPVEAICRVTEKEKEMIEEDISFHRSFPIKDTMSILSFCRFVHASMIGMTISPSSFPFDHVEFYRRIVYRLVGAHELPPLALRQFDSVFLTDGRREKSLAV
ncbi:MAG TPA: hypothetical protein VGI03_14635 [Verrucomicrobiae bacterium]